MSFRLRIVGVSVIRPMRFCPTKGGISKWFVIPQPRTGQDCDTRAAPYVSLGVVLVYPRIEDSLNKSDRCRVKGVVLTPLI